jgi:hypothetical protein
MLGHPDEFRSGTAFAAKLQNFRVNFFHRFAL